jgi:hypothetical protein
MYQFDGQLLFLFNASTDFARSAPALLGQSKKWCLIRLPASRKLPFASLPLTEARGGRTDFSPICRT